MKTRPLQDSKLDQPPGVSSLLDGIGDELLHLALVSEKCQATIGEAVSEGARKNQNLLRNLQNIDLITQSLFELALLLSCLSEAVRTGEMEPVERALVDLRLRDMANRLRTGAKPPLSNGEDRHDRSGKIDLF